MLLAAGRSRSAIMVLNRACELSMHIDDPTLKAAALEALLTALVEVGQVSSVSQLAARVDELESAGLEPERLALLRVQLVWADAVAGEPARGLVRVEDARALLPDQGDKRIGAALDAAEGRLLASAPEDAAGGAAKRLAMRALAAITPDEQPQVACRAWEVLGILARRRDLAESTACFRRAREMALRHKLPFRRLHAQLELRVDEWLSAGETNRLELARRGAERLGAQEVACRADTTIAIGLVLRSHYTEAGELIDRCRAQAGRAGLAVGLRQSALARSVLAAHQCRRQEMEAAMAELCDSGADVSGLLPLALFMSRTFCALLEENRELARLELRQAILCDSACAGSYPMAGWEGLHLLIERTSAGAHSIGDPDLMATTRVPFWNVPFIMLARAVLLGRQGRGEEALATVTMAEQAAAPYDLVRHLGLRLVAESAHEDGWGAPTAWLRRAEEYFYERPAQPWRTPAGRCCARSGRRFRSTARTPTGYRTICGPWG